MLFLVISSTQIRSAKFVYNYGKDGELVKYATD